MLITGRKTGKTGIVFTGIAELTRKLARDGEVWQQVQHAAVNGMIENTEDLLGRAMRDAPIDEGTLRASGTSVVYVNGRPVSRQGTQAISVETGKAIANARLPQMAEKGAEITHQVGEQRLTGGGLGDAVVGIVGFNTPYALVQHERLDYHHPKGGKAKYLEANLQEQAPRYQSNLETQLRSALA